MVEVFKTNVEEQSQADVLLTAIQQVMQDCTVNFDLEDCDRILRVKYEEAIDPVILIKLLKDFGFEAKILS